MSDDEVEGRLDPVTAARIAEATVVRARRALRVGDAPVFLAWGIAWLTGMGAMWWSVRDQEPYQGPSGGATAVLGVLLGVALLVTMIGVLRASRGVDGPSRAQAQVFGWSWSVGFGAYFAMQAALTHQGTDLRTLGILGTATPILITSLIYVVGSAIWQDRALFVVGCWLAVAAAGAAWAGPVGSVLVGALAGGGGLLVAAGVVALRDHRVGRG
jgi:hypothetical protein